MNLRANTVLIAVVFGLGLLFRGDWMKLIAAGLAVGFLVTAGDLYFDRKLLSFDSRSRWSVVKTQMVAGLLICVLSVAFAYWRLGEGSSEPGIAVAAAAAFLGMALGALFFEVMVRRRVRP